MVRIMVTGSLWTSKVICQIFWSKTKTKGTICHQYHTHSQEHKGPMHKWGQPRQPRSWKSDFSNSEEDCSLKPWVPKTPGSQIRWKEGKRQSELVTCHYTLPYFISSISSDGNIFILPNHNSSILFTKPSYTSFCSHIKTDYISPFFMKTFKYSESAF